MARGATFLFSGPGSLSHKDQARFLGMWPTWKGGSIRGLSPSPHGDMLGKKTRPWARSKDRRSRSLHPGPKVAGPCMSHFCFHSLSRRLEGTNGKKKKAKTNACEGKCNVFRNTGRGNISGVRKALPALTASGRSKPSRVSHYKVNGLPASATLVAQEVHFSIPSNGLDFRIRYFSCRWTSNPRW